MSSAGGSTYREKHGPKRIKRKTLLKRQTNSHNSHCRFSVLLSWTQKKTIPSKVWRFPSPAPWWQSKEMVQPNIRWNRSGHKASWLSPCHKGIALEAPIVSPHHLGGSSPPWLSAPKSDKSCRRFDDCGRFAEFWIQLQWLERGVPVISFTLIFHSIHSIHSCHSTPHQDIINTMHSGNSNKNLVISITASLSFSSGLPYCQGSLQLWSHPILHGFVGLEVSATWTWASEVTGSWKICFF